MKTGRVTTALNALNAELASFAQSRGIGFASGVYDLTVFYITQPLRIGGVSFILEGDADARPRYAFSGDDFHPNTCAQARVAQEILKAFTDKYPSPVIDRPAPPNGCGLAAAAGAPPDVPEPPGRSDNIAVCPRALRQRGQSSRYQGLRESSHPHCRNWAEEGR